jgi:hypothetical protein
MQVEALDHAVDDKLDRPSHVRNDLRRPFVQLPMHPFLLSVAAGDRGDIDAIEEARVRT